MSRPALIYAWLGSLVAAVAIYGCQAPAETFHLSGDASLESLSGSGGEMPGTGGEMPGTGGIIAASGGTVGGGGVIGSGGVASGGVGGRGGAMGGRGGATGGRGGATTGGASGAMGGRGGSSTGGSGGTSTGGRGGSSTGGRGGSASGGAGGADDEKILSIDFGVGGMGADAMGPTETAGAKPARRWNSAVGATGTLGTVSTPVVFADGSAATGTMVTWSAPAPPAPNTGVYQVGLTDATGDGHMMDGYLDPGMAPGYEATITVSGLRAPLSTSGYDVYVYFMAVLPTGVTRSHELSIGTKTFTVSQTGKSPTMFTKHTKTTGMGVAGDYVVFTNVTGASFTLTSDSVSASDNVMRAPVNGIQIVWPSGS